jgi:hypothetical protein
MVFQWFGLKTTGTVFFGLASKLVAMVFSGLTSKPVAQVSRFRPQNQQLWFSDLGLKITTTVSLGLKTKQASVCRLRYKIDGWRTVRDTR